MVLQDGASMQGQELQNDYAFVFASRVMSIPVFQFVVVAAVTNALLQVKIQTMLTSYRRFL